MNAAFILRKATFQFAILFVFAFILTYLIDIITNDLDTKKLVWDWKIYLDMLQYGVDNNNPNLYAPFAYRYGALIPCKLFIYFGLTTFQSFKLLAYIGAVTQLLGVYFLSYSFSKNKIIGLFCMLCIAFSFYHIKFLQNDIYRPDHLAYCIICINTYLVLKNKHFWLLTSLTIIGAFIREFTLVPFTLYYILELFKFNHLTKQKIFRLFISGILVSACVLLPRLLIPVKDNSALIHPLLNLKIKENYLRLLFYIGRNKNIILAFLIYFAPLILLITWKRINFLKHIKSRIKKYILIYFAIVCLMIFYGGTDVGRFITYLFCVQVLVIALIFSNEEVLIPAELAFVLVFLFIINGIQEHIPNTSPEDYLYFVGFHRDYIGERTKERAFWLCIGIITINMSRLLIYYIQYLYKFNIQNYINLKNNIVFLLK